MTPTAIQRRETPQASRSRGERWLALDLLRFCAVFLMVQGHAFSSLLSPEVRSERWYSHHNFVHGYTAPMFLFAAGLAFGYTTFRAWDAQTQVGPAFWKRMRRYAMLIVIGYALHLPSTSLAALMNVSPERLRAWLAIDVLQHIGVSLMCCQVLLLFARRPRVFAAIIAAAAALVVFAAPYVWMWDAGAHLPLALAGLVNSSTGALFPLVPWAGFTLAGILVAYAARGAKQPARAMAWPLAFFTALVLLVPIAINHTGYQPYPPHPFWRVSPYYFFWRLGNVTGLLTILCFAERFLAHRPTWTAPKRVAGRALELVRIVGAETLVIYVAHLLVLHGSVLNRGMTRYIGHSLDLAQASAVALVLFVAMVAFARIWHSIKTEPVASPKRPLSTEAPGLSGALASSAMSALGAGRAER